MSRRLNQASECLDYVVLAFVATTLARHELELWLSRRRLHRELRRLLGAFYV